VSAHFGLQRARTCCTLLVVLLLVTSCGGRDAVQFTCRDLCPLRRSATMRVAAGLVILSALAMTSREGAEAASEIGRRHDDVIVAPGRCLVRCLTLFQV